MKDAFGVEVSKAMTDNKRAALQRASKRPWLLGSPESRRANTYARNTFVVHSTKTAAPVWREGAHALRESSQAAAGRKPLLLKLLKPRVLP